MHKFRRLITIKAADDQGNPVVPDEIELLQTGEWNTPYHGHFVINRTYLEEYATHARDPSIRRALPVDWEHDTIGGAAAWLGEGDGFDYEVRDNDQGGQSLWASVKWTKKGKQSVEDDEYRYISPEFADHDYEDPENAGRFFDNVLIGAGLTNRPLFKKLTAVAASDGTGKDNLTGNHNNNIIYLSEENKSMNLKDLLAKKHEDLTTEEKAFITEHKADLTEDQVKELTEAGVLEAESQETDEEKAEREKQEAEAAAAEQKKKDDEAAAAAAANNDDGEGGTQASDKTVTIKAGELSKLKKDAELGRQAHDTLAKKEVQEHVGSLLFNEKNGGKLPIAAKDTAISLYESLNATQRKQFNDLMEKMPSLKMFGEVGDGGQRAIQAGSAIEQVMSKAKALMASDEGKGLTLAAAKDKVLKASDNKDLAAQYNQERKEEREGK